MTLGSLSQSPRTYRKEGTGFYQARSDVDRLEVRGHRTKTAWQLSHCVHTRVRTRGRGGRGWLPCGTELSRWGEGARPPPSIPQQEATCTVRGGLHEAIRRGSTLRDTDTNRTRRTGSRATDPGAVPERRHRSQLSLLGWARAL